MAPVLKTRAAPRGKTILFAHEAWNRAAEEKFCCDVEAARSAPALLVKMDPLEWSSPSGDLALTALAEGLQKREAPLEIKLTCGLVGDAGMAAIARLMAGPFPLVSLSFSGTKFRSVKSAGEQALVSGLDENHGLAMVDFSNALQDREMLEKCSAILSHCFSVVRVNTDQLYPPHLDLMARIHENREALRQMIRLVADDDPLSGGEKTELLKRRHSLAFMARENPEEIARTATAWNAFWDKFEKKTGEKPPRLKDFTSQMGISTFLSQKQKVTYLRRVP